MSSREVKQVTLDALEQDIIYPFFAVEMLFDTSPLRLWTGQGNLVFGGQTWTGAGTLMEISSVEETSEIAARGATITLSGIPSEAVSLALQEPYQGRLCRIYFGTFVVGGLLKEDGDFILLENGEKLALEDERNDLTEIFSGFMDQMNIEEGPESSNIELTVENKLIDLERQRVRRYTSSYQKSVYPGDKGFDFVESLQDKNLVWGRAEVK